MYSKKRSSTDGNETGSIRRKSFYDSSVEIVNKYDAKSKEEVRSFPERVRLIKKTEGMKNTANGKNTKVNGKQ